MCLRVIAVLSLLFFVVCFSYGQTDPLDDFWRDVERRKSLKKKELKDITSKYESRILTSFGNRIYVLQQDYIYENKDIRYVRGNDDYYGRVYGIGVSTDEGIVTSKHLLQPWKHDNSLLPSKGYSPVLTNIEIKSIEDTIVVRKDEGKYDINYLNGLTRYPNYKQGSPWGAFVHPDSFGILMLIYHEVQSDTFVRKIVEFKPKWKEGIAEIDTQLMSKELIGGLFFNLDTTQGKSDIVITAILSGDVKSEFKLVGLSDHLSLKPTDKTKERSDPKRTNGKDEKSHSSGKGKMEKDSKVMQELKE